MDAFLGVDLGTSGLKLTLVGMDGTPLAEAEEPYPILRPRPDWAEIDPARWVAALNRSVELIADRLRSVRLGGIGVTGQMHGAVLCNEHGTPVRPAVLWPDRRAEPQLDRWRRLPPAVPQQLANPLVPGMTGPILAWLIEHEPETAARTSQVLLPKDYLRQCVIDSGGPKLTGATPVTDRSDASGTLLWDVPGDAWSAAAVAASGVPMEWLPSVVSSDTVLGATEQPAMWDGRGSTRRSVPVVAGCGDTPAALLAVGRAGTDPDATVINLGTGAQVLRRVAEPYPVADPSTHLYAAADHGWYAMAAVQNAGLALDWAGRMLGLSWPELVAAAAVTPAGAGGVSFLPFLTGERGGLAGPHSHGGWLGLRASTSRAELARAALEAMVFAVRRGAELLGPIGPRITLTGGGGREPLVRQLIAESLGVPVHRIEVRSASATGAAVLAARAAGIALPVRAGPTELREPTRNPALAESYQRWVARLPAADT